MTPDELEKWTKKILKLISADGSAVLCTYKSMNIAEQGTWRHNGKQDVETFFGYQVTHDYVCLIRVCETNEDEHETVSH